MGTDSPDIVRCLLDRGVDCDVQCGERGETALHLAAVVGSEDSTRLLLDTGCDINMKTFYQETALWLAAWKGHVAVCRLLLERNCELNVPSNGCQVYAWDYLPFEIALGLGHFEIALMLLKAGCCVKNLVYFPGPYIECPGPIEELPWIQLRKEPMDLLRSSNENYTHFKKHVTNARRLKHLCRLLVRCTLGYGLQERVRMLPLPTSMITYLLFEDL